jgi:hypothetical protein
MEQDTQVQQDAGQEAQQPVGLTLQDLRVLAGSVELGAQRGAYRAGEMEVIGATYNKLATFLAANTPAETPADAPAETPADAPAETSADAPTETSDDANSEVTKTADSAE